MTTQLTRRMVLATGTAAMILPTQALSASDPVEVTWKDLRPKVAGGLSSGGTTQDHTSVPSGTYTDPRDFMVEKKFNGRMVRIPGYLVPLQFDGTGATEFLLVPYVGACIHVPPPPPNQLVHVTIGDPYEMAGLFEPVYAVGVLNTVLAETDLADVSYVMQAVRFEAVTFE